MWKLIAVCFICSNLEERSLRCICVFNSKSFGKELSSTSAYVSSRIFFPMSSNLSHMSSIVAMKSTGSPPGFIDLEKSMSRHARRVTLVLPSKRRFRAFQAAARSPTQPSSLLSCARTVMCVDPSVMKNRTEDRCCRSSSKPHVGSLVEGKVPRRGREVSPTRGDPLFDVFNPPTRGNRPRLCNCRCWQVLGEERGRMSPPWLRIYRAPQKSTNCFPRRP